MLVPTCEVSRVQTNDWIVAAEFDSESLGLLALVSVLRVGVYRLVTASLFLVSSTQHRKKNYILVLQSTVRYVRPRYVLYLHNSKCLTGKRGLDGKNLLCK